jgi:hypothetical protein
VNDLSPLAKVLVNAGRQGWQATDLDRARVLAKLSGAGTFVENADASARVLKKTSGGVWRSWTYAAVGGVSLGAFALLGYRVFAHPAPSLHSSSVHSAIVAPASSSGPSPSNPVLDPGADREPPIGPTDPQAREAVEPSDRISSTALATKAKASAAPRERMRDRLPEEVALLSKAEMEIHEGRAVQALRTLDEHASRFRDGALTEERMAARIQALCMLGRLSEADAQIDQLAAMSSHSPYLFQAREACNRARGHSATRAE